MGQLEETMSNKPIFLATHPRACSTAFERVFMTRRDTVTCFHEPFGDPFYYGPERLSERFENDEKTRVATGFADCTFKTIFDQFEKKIAEGKRLFIKDMAYYLMGPDGKPATIAPSLIGKTVKKGVGTNGLTNGLANRVTNGHVNGTINGETNGIKRAPYPYNTEAEPGNPTIVPLEILKQFHFTFLIRHPRSSIPSYYRCTIPPLDKVTGFYDFMPSEAGYDELRRIFDFLRTQKLVGPAVGGKHENPLPGGEISITVIDADDLLDHPYEIIESYCKEVGLEYTPDMLNWDTEVDQKQAHDAFEKWNGFHNDALDSGSLKPRTQAHKKKTKTVAVEDAEWLEKYGSDAQKVIRKCVNKNIPHYEYLKSFAIKV